MTQNATAEPTLAPTPEATAAVLPVAIENSVGFHALRGAARILA
jgi:hypothetical protein